MQSGVSDLTSALQRAELLQLRAEDAFNELDTDRNGFLDLAELRELLLLLLPAGGTEETVEKLLAQAYAKVDTNRDGRISFEEFIVYHNQLVDEVGYADDEFEEEEEDVMAPAPKTAPDPAGPPAAQGPAHGRRAGPGASGAAHGRRAAEGVQAAAAPPPPPPPPAPDAAADDVAPRVTAGAPPWELITLDELEMGERLGGGGMGAVHCATWRGELVAVKTMHDSSAAQLSAVEEELRVHAGLSSHEGVVRLMGANLAPPGCCIVMERCACSLFERLHRDAAALERRELVGIALQVADAMAFLHAQSPPVVHRDLKSHNVLLSPKPGARCKLCDFGLVNTREVTAGTPNYMAPELFLAKPYSASVDVFAFAVLLNECFTREVPWDGYQPLDIKDKVVGGERPRTQSTMPHACEGLLRRAWHQNAKLRPTFEQMLVTLREVEDTLPLGAALLGLGAVDSLDDFASLRTSVG